MKVVHVTLVLAALAVAGCSGKDRRLRDFRDMNNGPEEFAVEPKKPLEMPKVAELPVPTPGAGNRSDLTPKADTYAALGGRAGGGSSPATDSALIAHASRKGVAPNVRETMAEEDADFRRRRGRFTHIKLFKVDRYSDVYRGQGTNQKQENERFRRAGVKTPSAPMN